MLANYSTFQFSDAILLTENKYFLKS